MGVRANFDTDTREIEITEAPTMPVGGVVNTQTIDVQVDLYSDGKEDWLADSDGTYRGTRFPFVTAETAGEPLPGGKSEPAFYRIRNDLGWRLFPYDIDHELTLVGNLVPFDELLPIIKVRPGRTILIVLDGSQTAGLTSSSVEVAVDSSVTGGNVTELHRHTGLDPDSPKEIRDVVPDQDFDELSEGVYVQVRDVGGGVTRLTRIVNGHINVPTASLSLAGLEPTITVA